MHTDAYGCVPGTRYQVLGTKYMCSYVMHAAEIVHMYILYILFVLYMLYILYIPYDLYILYILDMLDMLDIVYILYILCILCILYRTSPYQVLVGIYRISGWRRPQLKNHFVFCLWCARFVAQVVLHPKCC